MTRSKSIVLVVLLSFTFPALFGQANTIYDIQNKWDSVVRLNNIEPNGAFEFVVANPELPDVLLIGTSISIGYTSNVRKILDGKVNLYRIPQNGGHTRTMLVNKDVWFPGKKWDVIHFNFGLHDLKYVIGSKLDLDGEQPVPIEQYKQNLDMIVPILKGALKEGGKLIFATTSVIPDSASGRIKGDEVAYNDAAMKVLNNYPEILIDDQYTLTLQHPEEQREKNVHFFPEGKERQGQQVAAAILKALGTTHQKISLQSPDKHLNAVICQNNSGHLSLEMSKREETILFSSPIGIILNGSDLGQDPVILTQKTYTIDEKYAWHGNHSMVHNHCNGIILYMNSGWEIDIRMYNDGLAFKYSYETLDSVLFNGESTALIFSSSLHAKYMKHRLAEESRIYTGSITDIEKSGRTMPPLLLYPEDQSEYIMLLEGGGIDFHGYSVLAKNESSPDYQTTSFKIAYAGMPNGWKTQGKINTAWKIICSVENLNKLVNTDLVHNVSLPPDPDLFPEGVNESWIKPGKSTWNWWVKVGVDFINQIELVDLAAEMGADYHLVDIGWDAKWKDEKHDSYEYLEQLCDYAGKKGIGIFVWKTSDVSFNLEQNKDNPNNKFINMKGFDVSLDTALMRQEVERIARAGAKGIKLDYIQSENSKWKKYMENFLKICAENKLMVDFHGCPIPAGESRAYPNEITREAIFGGEKLRGGGGAAKMPTSHYIDLLFTRLIAGHADYTPAIFSNPQGEGFTHAMQLASAMLFTSPLLCWADHPEEYLKSKGLELIRSLPTVWDETIVLDGSQLNDLVVYARRKGSTWYIAGINGDADKKQTYHLKLDFIKDRKYYAFECIDDVKNGIEQIVTKEALVSKNDAIDLHMLPSGGFMIRLSEKDIRK